MDKLESIRQRQHHDAMKRDMATYKSGGAAVASTGAAWDADVRRAGSTDRTRTMERTRTSERTRSAKRTRASSVSYRQTKKKNKLTSVFKVFMLFIIIGIVAVAAMVVWATWDMDFDFTDSFSRLGMNLTSVVCYEDGDGNEVYYERLVANQNRIWVDGDKVPDDLKHAFVAIEDQRFYSHSGVDIKRTTGAVINVLTNGDSSYGGSTITQQLIKNITEDSERSKARKIREMVRAVILESKKDKDEILELYMNSIYLGHGSNGVQAAAKVYFNKDVSELTLVECAAIAGITQYPANYDPIENPEANKERRQTVLDKMLELGYISSEEHAEAYDEKLKVVSKEDDVLNTSQSYFVDYLFEELLADLMEIKGYSQTYATDLIYNGGLKIIATVDPEIQSIMDDVYANGNGFPRFYGSEQPQSAMAITQPSTGELKGIVGGVGKKTGARVLNRAVQTRRQPGSTIKPIAVYGPAIDTGTITLASNIQNTPLDINGWKPKNANGKFSANVTVRNAVSYSYNLPAIRTLEELSVDTSYHYLTEKLHLQLVDKRDGSSDRGYPQLALGGLTDGVTVMEMTAAYAAFANEGEYIEPTSYTRVYDSSGNVLIDKTPSRNTAFSEETAFIMNQVLMDVMNYGTAAGYGIRSMDTCGKTGSTDSNIDRWFVGYTPYFAAAVWVGYDEQQVISYGGNNPALTIWHNIMKRVHSNYKEKHFEQPKGVEKVDTCVSTGQIAKLGCSARRDYVNTNLMTGYCSGNHKNIIGTPGKLAPSDEDSDKNPEDEKGDGESDGQDETGDNKSENKTDNKTDSTSGTVTDGGDTTHKPASGDNSGGTSVEAETPKPSVPPAPSGDGGNISGE